MSKVFRLRDRDGLELKCYGCDEWFSEIFIIANTPQDAIKEYEDNGGLCEECFTSTSGWDWSEILKHFEDGGVVTM